MAEPRIFLPGIERSSWSFTVPDTLDTFHLPGKHDQRSHGRRRRGTPTSSGDIPITGYSSLEKPFIEEALQTALGPLTKVDLRGVKRVSQRQMNSFSDGGGMVLGSYDMSTHKVSLSGSVNSFGPRADYLISNQMARQHQPNYHSPVGNSDPLTATLTHEVGHAAFNSMEMDQQDKLLTRLSDALNTERVPFASDALFFYGIVNQKAFEKKISMYAGNGTQDAIAEGWAEYRLASRPRLPAKVIGQTMEEFLT